MKLCANVSSRALNRLDAAVAAELADETAAGFQRAPHAGDNVVGRVHPVDCRVAEHGVELGVEGQPLAVGDPCVEPEPTGSVDLWCARIDADDVASQVGELLSERAIAASEVEDSLAGARREQFDYGRAEVGDEARVAGVSIGVPALIRVRHSS
jgi:hypothetical protein